MHPLLPPFYVMEPLALRASMAHSLTAESVSRFLLGNASSQEKVDIIVSSSCIIKEHLCDAIHASESEEVFEAILRKITEVPCFALLLCVRGNKGDLLKLLMKDPVKIVEFPKEAMREAVIQGDLEAFSLFLEDTRSYEWKEEMLQTAIKADQYRIVKLLLSKFSLLQVTVADLLHATRVEYFSNSHAFQILFKQFMSQREKRLTVEDLESIAHNILMKRNYHGFLIAEETREIAMDLLAKGYVDIQRIGAIEEFDSDTKIFIRQDKYAPIGAKLIHYACLIQK